MFFSAVCCCLLLYRCLLLGVGCLLFLVVVVLVVVVGSLVLASFWLCVVSYNVSYKLYFSLTWLLLTLLIPSRRSFAREGQVDNTK